MTNLDRLFSTLRHADTFWRAEQLCQKKNAVNEGAWSGQVIQQVLAALDWPRLRRADAGGSGAYFEWPAKHKVDVALLVAGKPKAFFELKQRHDSRLIGDVHRKIKTHPELRDAVFAVASWFLGKPGFCIYQIGPSSSLCAVDTVYLCDACNDPSSLVRLASPVLCGELDPERWLQSASPGTGPFVPRYLDRDVQRRFFTVLAEKLKLTHALELRKSRKKFEPPTPTLGFTELPGVFPPGWGLRFDYDATMCQLQCFFYRNSDTKTQRKAEKWNFENGDLSDAVLGAFVDRFVLPEIEKWRSEAMNSGLLG